MVQRPIVELGCVENVVRGKIQFQCKIEKHNLCVSAKLFDNRIAYMQGFIFRYHLCSRKRYKMHLSVEKKSEYCLPLINTSYYTKSAKILILLSCWNLIHNANLFSLFL